MNPRVLMKQTSALADKVVRPPIGVTVLIYHRVGGGSDSAVDLPVEQFEAQLAHLVEHHRILSLDEAVAELAGGAGWGSRPVRSDLQPIAEPETGAAAAGTAASATAASATAASAAASAAARAAASAASADQADEDGRRTSAVVVTFDDGTDDFVEHAVPALVRHGVPATLYVATEFVEQQTEFPWGAPPASWAGLREAVSTGLVTIGSHTHSHWLLDRQEPSVIAADLDTSIELIADRLDAMPAHFAYPKALPGSPAAEIAVRRRFRTAALAASRVNRPGRTDLHRLWRTPVQRSDDDEYFAAKAAGGMRLEGELRALLARVRYRGSQR